MSKLNKPSHTLNKLISITHLASAELTGEPEEAQICASKSDLTLHIEERKLDSYFCKCLLNK